MLKGSFDSIHELVSYVKDHAVDKQYIFRGQVRPWMLQSSLFRCKEEEQEKEWRRTLDFCHWILNNPLLAAFHEPNEQLIAIAQHHGFKTDLVDFTWDIEVAAYFATHSNRSEDLDENSFGVIWAIEVPQLKMLSMVFNIPVDECYEIKGLWRLENQRGLFVRDHGGTITQVLGMYHMKFKHSGGKYETNNIHSNSIYPEPNDFEREIERYDYYKNTINFKEEILPTLNMKVLVVPQSDEYVTELQEIEFFDWSSQQWGETNKLPFRRTRAQNTSSTFILPELESGLNDCLRKRYIELIKYYQATNEGLKLRSKIDFVTERGHSFNQTSLNDTIEEYIFTLLEYPYTIESTAESLHYFWRYLCYQMQIGTDPRDEERLCEAVYGQPMQKVGIDDSQGVATYAFIPRVFFLEHLRLTELRNYLTQKRGRLLKNNLECLFVINEIRQLFTLAEAIELWALYVNPYQCTFRPPSARIYSPFYVSGFGMP
jgi:hypothetical protein